ncbi:hypothetical protein QA596_06585 [Balneolales bacterium ANBcel1]|nr:hypothetical protein [Balneolales bacterium ANBcel1]
MKAVMIICNMIVGDEVKDALATLKIRGFTQWNEVQGKGSEDGDPHMGTHAWPSLNSSFLVVLPEGEVEGLLDAVKEIEKGARQQGIRAFVWSVEQTVG